METGPRGRGKSLTGSICFGMSDIEPQAPGIEKRDALTLTDRKGADFFVTNPPWGVAALHPLILNLSWFGPTWMLLYWDWLATKQAAPYMPLVAKVAPIGRVKWIPDSPHTGKENCSWVLFDITNYNAAQLFGRDASRARRTKRTATLSAIQ